jgi:hypothetical protein
MRSVFLAAVLAMAVTPAMAWDNTQTGPGPKSIADAGGMSQAQQAPPMPCSLPEKVGPPGPFVTRSRDSHTRGDVRFTRS